MVVFLILNDGVNVGKYSSPMGSYRIFHDPGGDCWELGIPKYILRDCHLSSETNPGCLGYIGD